ncbi:MAG: PepSY domain-containing protein, partial [Butyricicoccaceae bacterium]
NDAGLAERDLTDLRIWLENDDRRQEYHVEFRQDNIVYEYEIDAVSGTIRAFDRDDETATGNNTAGESNGNAISVADAKQTALKHAGFSEADVTRLEARLEKDDGRDIYDVEFYKDRTEYDYAIDANTGKILSYHIDAD